ncbi:MAG TPA: peptidase MA family metallohydrolase [Chloroflexia bacterium]
MTGRSEWRCLTGHLRGLKQGQGVARFIAILVLLLSLLPTLTAYAASDVKDPATFSALGTRYSVLDTQNSKLKVRVQEAKPEFPDRITFRLRASGFTARRATLNYSLVGQPVTAGVEAKMAGPTADLSLDVTLDLSTHYIPPGTEVSYYWTLLGASGETVDTPSKTFKVLDEQYKWQTLTDAGKGVSVHWYDGDQAFGENLLDTATAALERLERDVNASLTRPADIWVYGTQEELIDALPANIPEWVGGKAFPELALVLAAIADDENGDSETKRIVPHELSHLLLYQATRNPYNAPPAWLDEGLAVYNQETHYPEEEEYLKAAAEGGYLPPVKALSGSFGADEDVAFLSYSQSRSVVEFILNDSRYGPEKLARTVAAFKEGVTYDEALMSGLGVTVDELDSQWRASLPYKVAPPGSAPSKGPVITGRGRLTGTFQPFQNPFVLLALGMCGGLFLAGGLLTVVMLVRRGMAKT